jgi:hypothetical protein
VGRDRKIRYAFLLCCIAVGLHLAIMPLRASDPTIVPSPYDPTRGYGEPIVVSITATPRLFGRDAADFPVTVTPIVHVLPYGTGRGGPNGNGTLDAPPTNVSVSVPAHSLPISDAVIVALISAGITGVITLMAASIARRSAHETAVQSARLGGDDFLLKKVTYLEEQNARLTQRNMELDRDVARLADMEEKVKRIAELEAEVERLRRIAIP